MSDPINQIVIECITEDDGSEGWIWSAYSLGGDGEMAGGCAPTLPRLLASIQDYLVVDGDATPDLRTAIQNHHDTKHGATRSAAVLSPPDQALYAAAGIEHRTMDAETLDAVRRAKVRGGEVGDV